MVFPLVVYVFFFNDTATTEIYTLSLHDALPICYLGERDHVETLFDTFGRVTEIADRKSTRLNSSHTVISYTVFCLTKKKKNNIIESYKIQKTTTTTNTRKTHSA